MGRILVTGAAGYVGAHCLSAFGAAGVDALGHDLRAGPLDSPGLARGDLMQQDALRALLATERPDLVVHCAGLMDSGGAPAAALNRGNIAVLLSLVEAMRAAGVGALVLSSSCEVYGHAGSIHEAAPLSPVTHFGWSMMVAEQIVRDCAAAFGLRFAILRYFSASGALPELAARPAPRHASDWLWPILASTAQAPYVIEGVDHETRDGTPERDLLYVGDVASAHVAASQVLLQGGGNLLCNLGRGRGVTLREMLALVRRVRGAPAPVREAGRAAAPAKLYAQARLAQKNLGWRAEHGPEAIVRSACEHWSAAARSRPNEVDR